MSNEGKAAARADHQEGYLEIHTATWGRYVFPSEAAAAESADGRSSDHVVARDEAAALEQARARCVLAAL